MTRNGSVRGPRSALTSFLEEKGISSRNNANFNQFRRRQAATAQATSPTTNPADVIPTDSVPATTDNNAATSTNTVPTASDEAGIRQVFTEVIPVPQTESRPTPSKKRRVSDEVNKDDISKAKKAKKSSPKKKATKKKSKKGDSDSEDDSEDADYSDSEDLYDKVVVGGRNVPKLPPRRLRNTISEKEVADLENDFVDATQPVKAAPKRSRKPRTKLAHQMTLLEEMDSIRILSLQDMCIKFIHENIEDVESFGIISPGSKDKICKLICKHRKLNHQNMILFFEDYCPNSEINFYDCADLKKESFDTIALLNPNITQLRLLECGQLVDENIDKFSRCSNLEELHISGGFLVRDLAWSKFFHALSSSLRKVYLEHTAKISDLTISSIASCNNLRSLSLKRCDLINNKNIKYLSTLKSIESLDLTDSICVGDEGLNSILPHIGSTLTSLNVTRCILLTDAFLPVFAESVSKGAPFRELCLADLEEITDYGLMAICPVMSQKEIDSYEFNEDVADEDIESGRVNQISEKPQFIGPTAVWPITTLTKLDLARTSGLTIRSIVPLILNQKFNTLTHLNLHSCFTINCEFIEKILRHHKGNLQQIDLSWVRVVDDDIIEIVGKEMEDLKSIHIFGCNRITPEGIKALDRGWDDKGVHLNPQGTKNSLKIYGSPFLD